MGTPPRRTALRPAHSRHSTRSKHTHTHGHHHRCSHADQSQDERRHPRTPAFRRRCSVVPTNVALLVHAASAVLHVRPLLAWQLLRITMAPRALAPALARLARQSHALLAPADARPARKLV